MEECALSILWKREYAAMVICLSSLLPIKAFSPRLFRCVSFFVCFVCLFCLFACLFVLFVCLLFVVFVVLIILIAWAAASSWSNWAWSSSWVREPFLVLPSQRHHRQGRQGRHSHVQRHAAEQHNTKSASHWQLGGCKVSISKNSQSFISLLSHLWSYPQ